MMKCTTTNGILMPCDFITINVEQMRSPYPLTHLEKIRTKNMFSCQFLVNEHIILSQKENGQQGQQMSKCEVQVASIYQCKAVFGI